MATVPDAVLVRTSPNRSGKAIRGRLSKLEGKPYVSDEFVVYTKDDPSIRQTDHPHLLRKTEHFAAEALRLLYAEGRIEYAAVVLHRRAASKWARSVVDDIMSADPTARRFDGTGTEPCAAGAASGAAGSESGASESSPLPPPPPIPPLPSLTLSAPAAGGGGQGAMTDREAAVRRDEIAADALFASLSHWARRWDTYSAESESRLLAAVRAVLGLYDESHPARKSITNAMPSFFSARRYRKMPYDSTDVERAVRDVVHADRLAHRDIRCPESADASSKAPTFTGTCRRRGISPLHAFRKILRDPNWNILEAGRAPPAPEPPPLP